MNGSILIATESANINLNVDSKTLDMCLKTVSDFTSTTYVNICNGQEYVVQAGVFTYIVFSVVMVFALILILFLIRVFLEF